VIREEFNAEYRGVIIDDQRLFEDVRDYITAFNPELADRVEYYDADARDSRCTSATTSTSSCTRRSIARCGCRAAGR
jgi:Ribonuclease G/E